MRRFDIPAAPPLAGGRGDLLRLVDPRGLAVAWLDLRMGTIIGYATRPAGVKVGGWRELLGGALAPDDAEHGAPDGGAIAVGWPWVGATSPAWPRRWQLIERDPTAATFHCRCEREGDPPLVADLALAVSLDDGALCLRLVARANAATADFRAQLRLAAPQTSTDRNTQGAPIEACDQPEALVLRRAEAAWRLLVTPEPECAVTLAIDGAEAGVMLTLLQIPHHSDIERKERETVCALTMTIAPPG